MWHCCWIDSVIVYTYQICDVFTHNEGVHSLCVCVCVCVSASSSFPLSTLISLQSYKARLSCTTCMRGFYYFSIVAPQAEPLDTTTAGASSVQHTCSCFVVYYIILGCDIHKIYPNYGYACTCITYIIYMCIVYLRAVVWCWLNALQFVCGSYKQWFVRLFLLVWI